MTLHSAALSEDRVVDHPFLNILPSFWFRKHADACRCWVPTGRHASPSAAAHGHAAASASATTAATPAAASAATATAAATTAAAAVVGFSAQPSALKHAPRYTRSLARSPACQANCHLGVPGTVCAGLDCLQSWTCWSSMLAILTEHRIYNWERIKPSFMLLKSL